MASEAKRERGSARVSVIVPAETPDLLPAAAAELLKLLLDAHGSLTANQQPNRPEAA
jgi:hypothetical protein